MINIVRLEWIETDGYVSDKDKIKDYTFAFLRAIETIKNSKDDKGGIITVPLLNNEKETVYYVNSTMGAPIIKDEKLEISSPEFYHRLQISTNIPIEEYNKYQGTAITICNASNITINIKPGVVVKHWPQNENDVKRVYKSSSYKIFNIIDSDNIKITGGGAIEGESSDRPYLPVRFQGNDNGSINNTHGYGINIKRSHHIEISNLKIHNCYGDSIVISSATPIEEQKTINGTNYTLYSYNKNNNIKINNCELYNNLRQGITLSGADDIEVTNCQIHDIAGADPQAGIDIEGHSLTNATAYSNAKKYITNNPNAEDIWVYESLIESYELAMCSSNVLIENCQFYNCGGKNIQKVYKDYQLEAFNKKPLLYYNRIGTWLTNNAKSKVIELNRIVNSWDQEKFVVGDGVNTLETLWNNKYGFGSQDLGETIHEYINKRLKEAIPDAKKDQICLITHSETSVASDVTPRLTYKYDGFKWNVHWNDTIAGAAIVAAGGNGKNIKIKNSNLFGLVQLDDTSGKIESVSFENCEISELISSNEEINNFINCKLGTIQFPNTGKGGYFQNCDISVDQFNNYYDYVRPYIWDGLPLISLSGSCDGRTIEFKNCRIASVPSKDVKIKWNKFTPHLFTSHNGGVDNGYSQLIFEDCELIFDIPTLSNGEINNKTIVGGLNTTYNPTGWDKLMVNNCKITVMGSDWSTSVCPAIKLMAEECQFNNNMIDLTTSNYVSTYGFPIIVHTSGIQSYDFNYNIISHNAPDLLKPKALINIVRSASSKPITLNLTHNDTSNCFKKLVNNGTTIDQIIEVGNILKE